MMQRIGGFKLARSEVMVSSRMARAVLGSCVVVRCELLHMDDVFAYVATSPYFDELQRGELRGGAALPMYDVVYHEDGDRVEFKRQKYETKTNDQ